MKTRRGYADGPFGQVHFHDTGGEGQPLVLSHQSPQSARQFDLLVPALAAHGLRVVAVDHPGFGASDPTPHVPSIADYASVFPAVLDHLGIARADFAGHHTGAQVVTEISLLWPDRVRKLVINGPTPFTEAELQEMRDTVTAEEKDMVHHLDGHHVAETFQVRLRLHGPGANPAIITRMVAEKFIGYGEMWWGHNAAFNYDHAETMTRVRHPTLILTNPDDLIYDAALRAREIRPDFAFVELPAGGGVDVVDHQPQAWAKAVSEFLAA